MYNQAEYNSFFKKLRGYAFVCAGNFFYDVALKEEAIDKAMDKLEDKVISNSKVDVPLARKIVHDSLVDSFRAKDTEGDYSLKWPGRGVYHRINKNKPLRVRIDKITNPKDKIIMKYYSEGIRQADIAQKLNVSKSRVCQVVKKWTV